ncbi:MAG: VWA domain-containing protein [Vicinamibacterales bacterium]
MRTSRAAGAALVVLAAIAPAGIAGQAQARRPPQSFTASSTAILVDVVVRDSRGRPVTDLSAADFQVAEDGVWQTIGSFSRVSRGGIGLGVAWRSPRPAAVPVTASDGETPAPAAERATTALVYDRLSPETLRLAQKATLDYVGPGGESTVEIGVFATDAGVRAVQRYTSDRALVRRAVSGVLPSGVADEELRSERSDDLIARKKALTGEADAAVAMAAGGSGAVLAQNAGVLGQRENELRLVQTELNMLRSIANSERGYKGHDTASSLTAVVRSLAEYPGRKTVVFFSEGLPVSPSLSAQLDRVIDAANRANVTVYAVDTKGLRAKSGMEKARKELDAFAEDRRSQVSSGVDRTEQPLSMAMEQVEDTLHLDSRTGLARLSTDTGGFLIEGSNDLSSAFRRIDEDTQFHYLLTYAPGNDTLDGRFRAIRVKVARPGTQVFARKGYRALRVRPAADAAATDAAAMALLERRPVPNAFPVQAAAFSFPAPGHPGLSSLIVRLSTAPLRFDLDAERSAYTGRVTVGVRISDGEGREVQRLSQEYVLTGDAKDIDAARQGEILFYREPDLPPGVYTMEAIAFDALAGQGSVRLSTITIPAASPERLAMSSLVLVSRAEDTRAMRAADGNPAGPLYVGQTLLYPNLGDPIRKSAAGELTFYFALYGEVAGISTTAELLRNGRVIAAAPVTLAEPAGRRIQHVGRLPIAALPTGTYELRIQVTGAGRELSRTAYFTLQ